MKKLESRLQWVLHYWWYYELFNWLIQCFCFALNLIIVNIIVSFYCICSWIFKDLTPSCEDFLRFPNFLINILTNDGSRTWINSDYCYEYLLLKKDYIGFTTEKIVLQIIFNQKKSCLKAMNFCWQILRNIKIKYIEHRLWKLQCMVVDQVSSMWPTIVDCLGSASFLQSS